MTLKPAYKFIVILIIVIIITPITVKVIDNYINTTKIKTNSTPVVQKSKTVVVLDKSLVQLTEKEIPIYLNKNFSHLSKKKAEEITLAIFTYANKYKMSPLVLYGIIATESSFRWWITHAQVKVNDWNNKTVTTNAVGLGGIIYEIWGKKLIEAKVLETKADLYDVDRNIEAIAFIFTELYKMKAHPKADNNQTKSALIRYFGGGYVSYFNKIDNEIGKLLNNKLYK